MKKYIYAIVMFLITGTVFGQARSFVDSLYSESLGKTMPISIIVPSTYNEEKAIPILYLLHGHSLHHDFFTRTTGIEKYVEEASILCVMPEGNNSFWINSITVPEDRYEDYLMKDITNYIEKKFNIDTENQFIGGFSMGGYGAMIQALRHPDRFDFVICIAGVVMYPRDKEIFEKEKLYQFAKPSSDRAFGATMNKHRSEVDPFQVYKNTSPMDLPYILMSVGLQDWFPAIISADREFADSLHAHGAFHEYHELQGTHDSKIVDASLDMLLRRIQYHRDRRPYRIIRWLLGKELKNKGLDAAIKMYFKLKEADRADEYKFDEHELNIIGYNLLQQNRISDAIKIFKLNVEEYPEVPNTYDSLGEAFEKNNELEKAAEYYKKAYDIGVEQSSNSVNNYKRNLDRVLTKLENK